MGPQQILSDLWSQGITVALSEGGHLVIRPANALAECQRDLLRTNKAALVAFLQDAQETTPHLLSAAMTRCDAWGDDAHARQRMRSDCLATPPHQLQDLLEHFQQTTPRNSAPNQRKTQ